MHSSVLVEPNHVGLLAESLSAQKQVVLPDEAFVAVGDAAAAGFLAVLSGVRSELVGHWGTKRVGLFYKCNPLPARPLYSISIQ